MTAPIGLHLTSFSFPGIPQRERVMHTVRIAQAAEDAGFATFWANDHLIELQPPDLGAPRPETYMILATVAAATSRIRLGALASSIFLRNPILLARMVATLNDASGGRAILGVGAGHPRTEDEHRRFGFDFPPLKERMDRLEAALPLIRDALAGSVPVMIAGSGEHRLLRIVARHGDMCNLSMPAGDTLEGVRHKLDVLKAHCVAVGRDFAAIRKTYKAVMAISPDSQGDYRIGTLVGDREYVRQGAQAFINAGIDELIVQVLNVHDLDAIREAGDTLRELVTPPEPALAGSHHERLHPKEKPKGQAHPRPCS